MILTRELLEEKTTMKFGETGVYIFKNTLPLQIGYYAVDMREYDKLLQIVKPENLKDCTVEVYELEFDPIDSKIKMKYDVYGSWIPLGKRQLKDLEMLTPDEENKVRL